MTNSIWIISKYASPLVYGFASRHFYLAKEFSDRSKSVVVIGSDSNHLCRFPEFSSTYTDERHSGAQVRWIKTRKYKGVRSLGRILSWLDFEWKLLRMPTRDLPVPDVIVASSLSLLTVISGWILAKRFRAKLVVEIRDIWPLTLVEEGGFKPWNPGVVFLSLVERFGYSVADHVVGTMPNIAAHVENIGGDPNKCIGIPFGFDPEVYAEAEELPHEFQKFLPEPGKFVVGYAGSIGRTNSLDTFLDCAKKFVGNDKIHFLMVGSGDLREEYIAKTEGWPNITIAPRVEKSQVQSVLKCCSVLYFSVDNSKVWDYGLSLNKLIDYMYSEKPIIGSYSGFPSMINEAECGTLIPSEDVGRLEDEITRYSQMTEDELRNIGVRGRSWLFENRLYSKVADQYLDLIMD